VLSVPFPFSSDFVPLPKPYDEFAASFPSVSDAIPFSLAGDDAMPFSLSDALTGVPLTSVSVAVPLSLAEDMLSGGSCDSRLALSLADDVLPVSSPIGSVSVPLSLAEDMLSGSCDSRNAPLLDNDVLPDVDSFDSVLASSLADDSLADDASAVWSPFTSDALPLSTSGNPRTDASSLSKESASKCMPLKH